MSASPSAEIPEPAIEPCPWCGAAAKFVFQTPGSETFVQCLGAGCGACGPFMTDLDGDRRALTAWNSVAALRRRAEEARREAFLDCIEVIPEEWEIDVQPTSEQDRITKAARVLYREQVIAAIVARASRKEARDG